MYRPRLYRNDDPELVEAKAAAFDVLASSGAEFATTWKIDDADGLVLAGWSLGHGLATLLLAGNLDDAVPPTIEEISAQLGRGLIGLGKVVAERTSD